MKKQIRVVNSWVKDGVEMVEFSDGQVMSRAQAIASWLIA